MRSNRALPRSLSTMAASPAMPLQFGWFAHAVGESNEELKALIGAAPAYLGPGFLLPIRNTELFRWCLEQGLRVGQVMTLMSIGLYNEPQARASRRFSINLGRACRGR
jgi:hypothetical protein